MKENKSDCWNKCLSLVHLVLEKLMILFTFALYIRIILKTNQYILISWVSEIYFFNVSGTKRIISIAIAFLSLVAWIVMIATVIFFAWFQDYHQYNDPDKRNKFAHIFSGVSQNSKSRLYIVLVQLRRAIFVVLLIVLEPVSSILVISILVGLQLIYLWALIFIRPFELVKWNIIEIANEIYFLAMLVSLFKYNSVTSWEGTPTTI